MAADVHRHVHRHVSIAIYLGTMRNMGLAADAGREHEKAYEHLVVKRDSKRFSGQPGERGTDLSASRSEKQE
jgi:hypothetical protein